MKTKILAITAVAETATGLLLLAVPSLAVHALFGIEILDVDGLSIIMSRIAGVALIGLGVACWPNRVSQPRTPLSDANPGNYQLYGMLTYSILITLYLIRIGVRGAPVGAFLWPAVIVHAILIILLVFTALKSRKPASA